MLKLVGFALVALLLVSGQVLAATPQSSDASLGRLRSAVGQIVILVDGTGTKERVRLEDVSETEVVVRPLTSERIGNSTGSVAGLPRRLLAADVALVLTEDGRHELFRGDAPSNRLAQVAVNQSFAWLTTTDGVVRKGRLRRMTTDAVWLDEGGPEREYLLSGVRRVEVRDGLRNGALLGLALGALGAALPFVVLTDPGTCEEFCNAWIPAALLGAAAGSAAGAVIDFSHGREAIYETRVAAATAVSARPVLVRRGAGLMLQLAW